MTALRVAVYCRVSSDAQRKEGTIAAQLRDVPAFCLARGWTIVGTYVDDGKSASAGKLHKRDGFNRLLADAAAGRFDVVAVVDQDRLTRSTSQRERGAIMGALQEAGVKIAIASTGQVLDLDTDEGDLMGSFGAYFAAAENRKRTRRMVAGKETTILRGGKPRGPTPMGLVYTRGNNQRNVPHAWAIDERAAATIREIVKRVADGESPNAIARDLNLRGIKRTRGRLWDDFRIRQIAACPTYAGRLMVDKKRRRWVPVPPIVTEEAHEEAKARLVARYRRPPVLTKHHRLLAGLARCGVCGGRIGVTGYVHDEKPRQYYICRDRVQLGAERCALPLVPAMVADDELWSALAAELASRTVTERALADGEGRAVPGAVEDAAAEVQRLDALTRQAYDDARAGRVAPEVSAAHVAELGRARAAAVKALRAAQAAAAGLRTATDAALVDEAAGLFRRWSEAADPAARREIVRRSVASVTVGPEDMQVDLLIDVPSCVGGARIVMQNRPAQERLTVATPRTAKRRAA